MMSRLASAILGLSVLLVLVGVSTRPDAAPAAEGANNADTFTIDGVHSNVIFKIEHLGVSSFFGRFNDVSGSFLLDRENPDQSRVEIVVKYKSVDTNASRRDRHLKSPDFFNADEFPTITFTSTSVTPGEGDTFKVDGKFTLLGTTRPLSVTLNWIGEGDRGAQFGYRGGFDTTFTIKRSDFGMDWHPELLGDDVTLFVGIEGQRR